MFDEYREKQSTSLRELEINSAQTSIKDVDSGALGSVNDRYIIHAAHIRLIYVQLLMPVYRWCVLACTVQIRLRFCSTWYAII